MRAELLDIDRDRRGEPLRAQHVEAHGAAVRVGLERQPVFRARLVAGDEWRAVLDRGVGAGEMRDAWLVGHGNSLLAPYAGPSPTSSASFPARRGRVKPRINPRGPPIYSGA